MDNIMLILLEEKGEGERKKNSTGATKPVIWTTLVPHKHTDEKINIVGL